MEGGTPGGAEPPPPERLSLRLLREVVKELSEELERGSLASETCDTICRLSGGLSAAAADGTRRALAGHARRPATVRCPGRHFVDDLDVDSPKGQQGLLLAFNELDAEGRGALSLEAFRAGAAAAPASAAAGNSPDVAGLEGHELLLRVFRDLDGDGSGTLSTDELRVALVAAGIPKARAQKILFAADADGSGEIEYSEWEAAVKDGGQDSEFVRLSDSLRQRSLSGENLDSETSGETKPTCMLRPDSALRLGWDLCLAVLCVYIALVLPFTTGFSHWIHDDVLVPVERLELAIDVFFLLDVCINFRTGILLQDGTMVLDWRRVGASYAKSWLFLDLAASIPLSGMLGGSVASVRALKLMKIPKLLKAVRVIKSMVMIESTVMMVIDETLSTPFLRGLCRRSSMFILTVLLCHWLACLMAFCSTTWLSDYLAKFNQAERLWSIFLAAIYWAMTTMTTLGWGDISATTDNERCYVIFAMVIGGAYYGYAVGTVVSMVSNRDLNASAYHERMDAIYAWLDHHKLPSDVRRRIIRYFKTYLAEKAAINEADVVNDLSPSLRNEVGSLIIHADILNNPILDNVPMNAVTRLQNIVNTMYTEEGHAIVHAGESGTAMFILNKGLAKQEFSSETGRSMQPRLLSEGDSFGEEILCSLSDTYCYTVTVIKNRACLFIIEEEKFHSLFEHMPDVIEQVVKNAKKLYASFVRKGMGPTAVTDLST